MENSAYFVFRKTSEKHSFEYFRAIKSDIANYMAAVKKVTRTMQDNDDGIPIPAFLFDRTTHLSTCPITEVVLEDDEVLIRFFDVDKKSTRSILLEDIDDTIYREDNIKNIATFLSRNYTA